MTINLLTHQNDSESNSYRSSRGFETFHEGSGTVDSRVGRSAADTSGHVSGREPGEAGSTDTVRAGAVTVALSVSSSSRNTDHV